MMWQAYRLVSDDVLFFRDGKPSSRGEDHYLRSMFPPSPSVLYGAIRTGRLLEEGVDLTKLDETAWGKLPPALLEEIGPWGGFGSLCLRGPWLQRDDEVLLPAPADLGLVLKEGSEYDIDHVVRYVSGSAVMSGKWSHESMLASPYVQSPDGWKQWDDAAEQRSPVSAAGWFLKPTGMNAWLEGKAPEPGEFLHSSLLWVTELRTGVGLAKDTRAAEKGMLYTFGFVRLLRGVSIGFEIEGSLQIGSRLRLGAEGRTAEIAAGEPFPFASSPAAGDTQRTIAFATPSLSEDGALPPRMMKARVRAAFVRGALLIGGWDIAKRRSKALRRAIPAGSVYVIDCDTDDRFHGTNFSDGFDMEAPLQGFGLTLAGRNAAV
jgi:CRISPR-associated protein Cmr3